MHNEIKKRLEERMNQSPRLIIERIVDKDKDTSQELALFTKHATSMLEGYQNEMSHDAKDALKKRDKLDSEVRHQWNRIEIEEYFMDQIISQINKPLESYHIHVQNGTKIIVPPYDTNWDMGLALNPYSRYDGKVRTWSNEGQSAGGIGFYLTTNNPIHAVITPKGNYEWVWMAFDNLPYVSSRGGLGITIYKGSELIENKVPTLWKVNGIKNVSNNFPISGQTGKGLLENATGLGGTFLYPLAPAVINMVPGSQYLVWVWCWQVLQGGGDKFIASISFEMPNVTVEVVPQPIVN